MCFWTKVQASRDLNVAGDDRPPNDNQLQFMFCDGTDASLQLALLVHLVRKRQKSHSASKQKDGKNLIPIVRHGPINLRRILYNVSRPTSAADVQASQTTTPLSHKSVHATKDM